MLVVVQIGAALTRFASLATVIGRAYKITLPQRDPLNRIVVQRVSQEVAQAADSEIGGLAGAIEKQRRDREKARFASLKKIRMDESNARL